jgi:heme exporter protein A
MSFIVSNLSCGHQNVALIANLNFKCLPGESLILRGENGIGKTTLLRCLAGLIPPLSGSSFSNPDSVAYIGHSNGLKLQLTVLENLYFWQGIYHSKNLEQTISEFKLEDILDFQVMNLSAGQRRRTALSRLKLTQCPLWALDEPLTSLDSKNVTLFTDILQNHLDNSGIAVIATHVELQVNKKIHLELEIYKAEHTISTDQFSEETTR